MSKKCMFIAAESKKYCVLSHSVEYKQWQLLKQSLRICQGPRKLKLWLLAFIKIHFSVVSLCIFNSNMYYFALVSFTLHFGFEIWNNYQLDAIEYLFMFFQLDMFRAYTPVFRSNGCYNFFTYVAYGVLGLVWLGVGPEKCVCWWRVTHFSGPTPN